jgi:putative SOS response-associated peptidase YedK
MCGRYQISISGKEISTRFSVDIYENTYVPKFNCAPTQLLPVISNEQPKILSFYRWGLIPFWAKDAAIGNKLINARAETITDKPSFKKAFEHQRCLIPANGFFEWRKSDKQPFRVFLKNENIFAMAGIWDKWLDENNNIIKTFSIITTKANDTVNKIHSRMPVILPREKEETWLKENNTRYLKKLLKPIENKLIAVYPVSKKINSPKNDLPELIYPLNNENIEPTLF